MTSPYQSQKRIDLTVQALIDPNFVTVWERTGVGQCLSCDKILRRGIDIDIYCNACWDASMLPDEATPEEIHIHEVAKTFSENMRSTESQAQKESILRSYQKEYRKMEKCFLTCA